MNRIILIVRQHLSFFLTLCIALHWVPCSINAQEHAAAPRPNVLLILADDLGFSDIGCYGSEIATPNLDRLARNGLRFMQMHNTSKCFPSRAALLTGLYARQAGMHDRPGRFDNGIYFGEVLRQAGYRTLFIGKHHSTDNPFHWGFDHYRGLRDGACNYFNPGLQREGEPLPAQKRYGQRTFCFDEETVRPFTPPKGYYSTDTWTDWAIELLEKYKSEDKPFCLYIAYQAPHDPLQAWPEDIKKYENAYSNGYESIAQKRYERQRAMGLVDDRYPRSDPEHRSWEALSREEKADQMRRMAVYAAMIDRMDQNIGRLVEKIEGMGELENTLILFLSDNGASAEVVRIGDGQIGDIDRWASLESDWANVANTPFRKYKNFSHEGGTCTPFVVHWPRVIREGSRIVHTATHFIDIMPTLLDISGAEYPKQYRDKDLPPLSGVSLVPLFKGSGIHRKHPLFFQWSRGKAVLTQRWKLVMWERKWELYDRNADRTETTDVSGLHPEVVNRLAGLHTNWLQNGGTLK